MLKHIEEFIKSFKQRGYNVTITDIVLLSLANCHRTTFDKFLSKEVWNISFIWKGIRKFVIITIYLYSLPNLPIFAIYDDTIAEKTKSSSKDENTIQKTGFHNSHLKGN